MEKSQIVLSIYGQNAVNMGYKFQNGYCYRGIFNHGKKIAQLEVVLDEPGTYNGFSIKWVDATILNNQLEATLVQLKKIGFSGCWAEVVIETENGNRISDGAFIRI